MSNLQQQINLYQSAFRKPRIALSALHVVRLSIVLVAGLAIVNAFTQYKAAKLQIAAKNASTQLESLKKQTEEFNQLARQTGGVDAAQTIAELKQMRAHRQSLLENMSAQHVDREHQFSSYFEGLARHTFDGLWLESIRIGEGGEAIQLNGKTYRPELIPKLIASLKSEPAFRGITFHRAEVNRHTDEGEAELLKFSLATRVEEEQRAQ